MTTSSLGKLLCAYALALVACDKGSGHETAPASQPERPAVPAPSPEPAAKPAPTPAPAPIAKVPNVEDVLKAQLDAVKHWSDDSPMQATFAPNANILLPNGEHPLGDGGIAAGVALLDPQSTVREATYDHFTSGHNADVAWLTADLHFTVAEGGPPEKRTIRAIELFTGASGWKVVVAAFTNVDKLAHTGSSPIKDATDADRLTNLLIDPGALATALDADAVVLGTDATERGQGADAKALLTKWKTLKLALDTSQKVREVHDPTYGYAMANVRLTPAKGGDSTAMNAFVLALPAAGGSWSVVAASYGATF